MRQTFTIPGRFCSLNEFYRMHRYEQAKTKSTNDDVVAYHAKAAKLRPVTRPVDVCVLWVEPNRRRDLDNIHFGVKFVLDGLVKAGILHDDARPFVKKITHEVSYDRNNPRIEVTLNG